MWVCNLTAHLSEAGYITPDRKLACHQVTPVQISSGTPKPFLDDIRSSKYANISGKFQFDLYIIISCHVLWKWFNLYWLLFLIWWPPPHVFNIAISSSRDSQCVVCLLCGLDVKLKQFFWGTSSRLSMGPGLGCWKPMTNILSLSCMSCSLIPACQFPLHSRLRTRAKGGGYRGTSST